MNCHFIAGPLDGYRRQTFFPSQTIIAHGSHIYRWRGKANGVDVFYYAGEGREQDRCPCWKA